MGREDEQRTEMTKYCSVCYRSVADMPCDGTHCPGKNAAPPVSKEPAIETAGLAVAAPLTDGERTIHCKVKKQ